MQERVYAVQVRVTMKSEQPYKDLKRTLVDAFEARYVTGLMERHRGNISAASRESGLSRRHLRELLRKYDLYRPPVQEVVLRQAG